MEREAPISFWMPPGRFAFLNKSLGTFLDRKACLKLLDAPLASLAALARSLRSPYLCLLGFRWDYAVVAQGFRLDFAEVSLA